MLSSEIEQKLKRCHCFVGVFPRDKLPTIKKYPFCVVVNTDPANKPGQHWVAIFGTQKKTEYFDSFGLPPFHHEILNFIENCKGNIEFNTITLQTATAKTCGHYCVIFILMRCEGYTFDHMISIFTRNTLLNDILAKLYKSKA